MFLDAVLVGTASVLAILVYLFKRHAGQAILAMMAGAFIAGLASIPLAEWLGGRGVTLSAFSLEAAVAVACILVPFVIVWLGSGKNHGGGRQLIGGLVAGLVGVTILTDHLPTIFNEVLFSTARIDDILIKWHNSILIGGFLFALIDLLLAKRPGGKEEKHHRK